MTEDQIREALELSLHELVAMDGYLFSRSISERCLTARLAMHLQRRVIGDWFVDVEYNRKGLKRNPKTLDFAEWGLSEACANPRQLQDKRAVTPDLVVHQRGPAGPNLLVLEAKKSTNEIGQDCDVARIQAFREKYLYQFGAVVEFETRRNQKPSTRLTWFSGPVALGAIQRGEE